MDSRIVLHSSKWCIVLGFAIATAYPSPTTADDTPVSAPQFERDVAPILTAYCWRCHGGEDRVAELDLRTLPLMLRGGKSGPAIVPGSAEKSLLFQKLSQRLMPPKDALRPTDDHLAVVRAWIEAGAPARYRGELDADQGEAQDKNDARAWWAFRPPTRPAIPEVSQPARVRSPIDAFLLDALESNGVQSFAPGADRITLLRRVYFDLTGLPPSPEQADAFLSDPSPDAYEKLTERLLASEHYGERWGRHWLDAAGYVDTIGIDNDAAIIKDRPRISRYRDYVIRAFNDDKPYDRFLLEQLAGDELVDWRNAPAFTPEIEDLLVATGFLRQVGDTTNEPELNTADIRHQVLYDALQNVGSNLLGLTLHCARCHDHKFDAISQRDYYQMAALLTPAINPQRWKHSDERFLPDVSTEDKKRIDTHNAGVDGEIAKCKERIAAVRQPFERTLFEAKLAGVPEPIRVDTQAAIETAKDERSEVQKYLAEKFGAQLEVATAEVDKALDAPAQSESQRLRQQIARLETTKRTYGRIHALWDVGAPPPTYLYRRGDYTTPGSRVRPGVIAVLDSPERPFAVPASDGKTSGYRTALARWLTRDDHPLTARVIVNRVWQQYFTQGIVATPDNFGTSGAKPTHPELLDWLATEFIASGWRFKHLHRLILSSTAYRQASRRPTGDPDLATAERVDPDNHLLWRMPLRRLESEIIRDRVLAVSGMLAGKMYGPPIPLSPNPDGSVDIDMKKLADPWDHLRRSVYILSRRNYHLTELDVFDQPQIAHNCTRRRPSAVVQQSLTMLNGQFIFEQSERFAERVMARTNTGPDARIATAFRLALIRTPTETERVLANDLLTRQASRYRAHQSLGPQAAADAALVDLCHMLFNTNEFLYLE